MAMKLANTVTLTIPTTIAVDQTADSALVTLWTERIRNLFASLFGGVTVTRADGGWVADDGSFVQEPVILVTSLVSDDACPKLRHIAQAARVLGRALSQEAILIRWNHEGFLLFAGEDY